MTDKSMRERLARRLCYVNCQEFGEKSPACPSLKCKQHGLFYKEVDAILAELRDPDEAVLEAMGPHLGGDLIDSDVRVAWQAGIDAIKEDS